MSINPVWSRLVRFTANEDSGTIPHYGEPIDATIDVGQAYLKGQKIKVRLLNGDPFDRQSNFSGVEMTVKKLLSPLDRSTVGTIRALGANFVQDGQDEAEAKKNRPKIPILFYKPLSALSNPSDPINIPKIAQEGGDQSDYEVELVVVIGTTCRDISASQAQHHILGYTLSNDVSARRDMFSVPQWGLGKSFDGWFPMGPTLVSPQMIGNPENVQLRTVLNGKEVQNGNTKHYLWNVYETVSRLSQGTTLERGSVISMGTTTGEGFKKKPQPIFLKDGDIVECSGNNGLGTLINPVVEEGKSGGKARL